MLQWVFHVGFGGFDQTTDIDVPIVQKLPEGYTGYLSERVQEPALLTSAFAQTVLQINCQTAVNMSKSGCTGQYSTTVRAAGFLVECSTSTALLALTPITSPDSEFNPVQDAVINGTLAFGSTF